MKLCPKCGTENVDTAKFCNECGTVLEIQETEPIDQESIERTQDEAAEPEGGLSPSPEAEATTNNQKMAESQTENNQENMDASEAPQPEKKKTVKLKRWQKVLIAIVALLAILIFRPRITHVSIGYKGETAKGTVLDNDNPGFYAVGTTNYGKEIEIPYTELKIKEPKTLKADGSETVTVYYKNASVDLTVQCTTTLLKTIDAKYNGSTIEGTVINKDSDFTVTGTFGDGHTQKYDNSVWYLTPSETTLKAGETSTITVSIDFDNGTTRSMDVVIKGTEKPFTEPQIEGDYYNCSIDQFVKYINDSTTLTLFPMDVNTFGEEYKSYGIIPPKEVTLEDGEALVLGLRENNDGKLSHIMVWSSAPAAGMWTSLQLAGLFDDSINTTDRDSLVTFLKFHVYEGDDMIVYYEESNDHYDIYLMTRDYYNKNIKQ